MRPAVVSSFELMREVEASREKLGLSKAELARRGRLQPETVRHLLTSRSANPTLSNTLAMLRPLGLGLTLTSLSRSSDESSDDVLEGWLAHYGASLYGIDLDPAMAPPPEVVLSDALGLARRSATVARALPQAFWRCRRRLDFDRVLDEGRRRGRARELGFFLDLVHQLSGEPVFGEAARRLKVRQLRRPRQFFTPTTARERRLAELVTPEPARRWGFRMNMDMDCFRTMFEKGSR
jgi:transcriptional regulator with XRE-family HTH domain